MADFEKTLKKMLVKEPFYALLLLQLNKRTTTNNAEMDTIGVYREGLGYGIIVNTNFFDSLTDEEARAVLMHECQHIFLGHLIHRFPNHRLGNFVQDLEINQMIENLPKGGIFYEDVKLRFPDLEEKAGSQYYYKYMLAHPQNSDGGGGEGGSNPQSDPGTGDGNPFDANGNGSGHMGSHSTWKDFDSLNDAEKELIEETANGMLKTAAEQVQKARGTIPGCFESILEKLLAPKPQVFNWKAYFRRLLGTSEEWTRKSTRKKPSKRFEGAPGAKHKHKQRLLVAVDTSGSVMDSELQDFFNEINYIWKAGAQIDVLEYDATVNKIWAYKGQAPEKVTGRGGTVWQSAYEWYVPRMKNYSAFVTFTDGYDYYSPDRGLRNGIFVVTSNGDKNNTFPGKTVFIPQTNN